MPLHEKLLMRSPGYQFAWAAITQYYKMVRFNYRSVLSHSSEGNKPKRQELAELLPSEGSGWVGGQGTIPVHETECFHVHTASSLYILPAFLQVPSPPVINTRIFWIRVCPDDLILT